MSDQIRKLLQRKQWAYRALFGNPELNEAAKIVLADLVRITGLNSDTVPADPVQAYGVEMSRIPVKRIFKFLKLEIEQAYDMQEDYNEFET